MATKIIIPRGILDLNEDLDYSIITSAEEFIGIIEESLINNTAFLQGKLENIQEIFKLSSVFLYGDLERLLETLVVSQNELLVFVINNLIESIITQDSVSSENLYYLYLLDAIATNEQFILELNSFTFEFLKDESITYSLLKTKALVNELVLLLVEATGSQTLSLNIEETNTLLDTIVTNYLVIIKEILTNLTEEKVNTSLQVIAEESNILILLKDITTRLITTLSFTIVVEDLQKLSQAINEKIKEYDILDHYFILEDLVYKALVLNTETEALYTYANYNFNSFSGSLAANDTGIYKLEGDSDDGEDIIAWFETGFMDFGSNQLKRFQPGGIYLGFANDGSAIIRTAISNSGVVEEDWYEEDKTFSAFDTERLQVHDGIKSRYWKFKVMNKDGSHLDLDTLQMYPIILSRRIR